MKSSRLILPLAVSMMSAACSIAEGPKQVASGLDAIGVSPDGHGFVSLASGAAFHPWGVNYGHGGLIEDFWTEDWARVADDSREMRQLGANVARVHLQFGKFMTAPGQRNRAALAQLSRLLRLAEVTGLYLDLT